VQGAPWQPLHLLRLHAPNLWSEWIVPRDCRLSVLQRGQCQVGTLTSDVEHGR